MNKPKHFLIFKLIGFIGIGAALIGIILTIDGFGNFGNNNFMIGGFLTTFGLFIGISCLTLGFSPEISRMNTKTVKYIQEENKSDLKDIANTTADIIEDAVNQTSRAAKDGFSGNNPEKKMYCKHCGVLIDADSVFCNKCGKEQ